MVQPVNAAVRLETSALIRRTVWLSLIPTAIFASLAFVSIDSTSYVVLSTVGIAVFLALFLLLVVVTSARVAQRGAAIALRRSTFAAATFLVLPAISIAVSGYVGSLRLQAHFDQMTEVDPVVAEILRGVRPPPLGLLDAAAYAVGFLVVFLLVGVGLCLVAVLVARLLGGCSPDAARSAPSPPLRG